MLIIVFVIVAFALTFAPLAVAVICKAKRLGSAVATIASLTLLALLTFLFSGVLSLTEEGKAPLGLIVISLGLGLLCLIAGAFLFFTADDNN